MPRKPEVEAITDLPTRGDPPSGAMLPSLTPEQLSELLILIRDADSVELKLTVADSERRSAVSALGMDPLDAHIRQVAFFDTADLDLYENGVVVRARRVQRKAGDTVVKLRPLGVDQLKGPLRGTPGFGVEVDAMPGGFVCSGSLNGEASDRKVKKVMAGLKPVRGLLTAGQVALFDQHAPAGIRLEDLAVLGPINIIKLKFSHPGYPHRLVAELWFYPDGSRILELSTKCDPVNAFTVAAETKAFLAGQGVDLMAAQQTKTLSALRFFAQELASGPAGPTTGHDHAQEHS